MDILDKIASMIDGREYREETTPEIEQLAKLNGVVIAYGASDDLLELRGAVDDEVGAWDGVIVKFNSGGIVKNDCDYDDCPYFKKISENAHSVELIWDSGNGLSWQFHTDILHKTFMIYEDGEKFCEGIVFELCGL